MPQIHPPNSLNDIILAQKSGQSLGIYSICSSHPQVLQAALRQAQPGRYAPDGLPVLIESTSNQVNQEGGYTGLTPVEFRRHLLEAAKRLKVDKNRIWLGGDHLGPNAWQDEPAEPAMAKGSRLIWDCIQAGYIKIHLDASMPLADDPAGDLPLEVVAKRTAQLCQAAEAARQETQPSHPKPYYVIGTEVPPAGGAKSNENQLEITSPQRAQETLQEIQKQFYKLGLEHAWQQVIALVVQPGVEFGDAAVHPYQPAQAAQLSQLIEHYSGIIFEAHSTDYQTRTALRQLVQDHFAILKVGPALTFAYREAVFALEWIERELLGNTGEDCLSRLSQVLEAEMLANPKHWQKYYAGSRDIDITSDEQRLARRFSLSDRIRYYWPRPPVQQALERLLNNLQERQIPLSLVSQFFPLQFPRVLEAELAPHPLELIQARIDTVLQDYNYACYML